MDLVVAAATIAGTGITFIGVFWTVVFGPRNLVSLMASKQSNKDAMDKVESRSNRTRSANAQRAEVQSKASNSRYARWLSTTGRLAVLCWVEFDPDTFEGSLPEFAGFGLRACLFLAPFFMIAGVFFTGVGIVVPNGGGALYFGLILLVAFLAALIGEFFLIGTIALIGLFLTLVSHDDLDD